MVKTINILPAALAQHLQRYRLTTAAIVAARHLCDCSSQVAAEQLLNRFVYQGALQKGPLALSNDSPRYYLFTPRAAQQLGVNPLTVRQQSLNDRLSHWAISQFCAAERPFRELLTKDEFCERFAPLWRPGQPLRYYLEPAKEGVCLAFLKVDLGGPSRWDRVVDACYRFLEKRTPRPSASRGPAGGAELFRQLIEMRRFQISLLVACPEKEAAINARLDLDAVKHGVRAPIVPYAVPGLFDLLLDALPGVRRQGARR